MKININANLVKRIKDILKKENQKCSEENIEKACNILIGMVLVDHQGDINKQPQHHD